MLKQWKKNESKDRWRGQMGQSDYVTPLQRRHHGLYNQGATCYLNSVLQVLFMTTEIHGRLDPQTDQELMQIFTDLKTKTCRTENITMSLKIENVHEQRDAAECLRKILHHISPEASEVFQGQLRDTTKCSKDHIINEETNPFWTLPLSLKHTPDTTYSVESSFERTFQTKAYTCDNMKYCNDCKQKTEATSSCEMVEAPQILILLLKRFDFDYNTRSHFKSDCCVEVPCELQLKNKTYKLYGMVNHMGSLRGGRYTATVLSEDNTWYECNDSHVSKVEHQLFAEDGTFSSRTVYLLTYRATELNFSCMMRGRGTEMQGRGVTQSQRRHYDPNNQGASHSLNSVLKTPEMHDRGRTAEQDASVNVGEQQKDSCQQHLDEETKTEKEEQRAVVCLEKILHLVSTEASEVFRGQLRATTKCPKCHTITKETKTICIILSGEDSHDTSDSEESSFRKIVNTKTCTGDNKVSYNERMKAKSSSAKKMIIEHKVELIDCLMADPFRFLQHAHQHKIITDRQYQNIMSLSTPEKTVTELIDDVILKNGPESSTAFLEVLKLPEVLSTYPQLKEIINKMLRSNNGNSA